MAKSRRRVAADAEGLARFLANAMTVSPLNDYQAVQPVLATIARVGAAAMGLWRADRSLDRPQSASNGRKQRYEQLEIETHRAIIRARAWAAGSVSAEVFWGSFGRFPLAEHSTSAYHRGDMDIHEQSATYSAVYGMIKWCSLALAASLTGLVIWFCTPAGFFPGFVVALIITVLGVFGLRSKPGAGH